MKENKTRDYIIDTIIKMVSVSPTITFYQIKRVLKALKIDLDKKCLLTRLRDIDFRREIYN